MTKVVAHQSKSHLERRESILQGNQKKIYEAITEAGYRAYQTSFGERP